VNSPVILRDPIQIEKLDIVGETLTTLVADVNRSKRIEKAELKRKQTVKADNQALLNKREELENLWANKPKSETPKLAYTVTFPKEENELALVPKINKLSLGAPLPSHQGFVDWLCEKAAKEVRKIVPGGSFLSQQLLQELCVLGIETGYRTIPALKHFVKSKLTSKRMARLTAKPQAARSVVPAGRAALSTRVVSAPVSMSRRISARNKPRFSNKSGNVTISHTEFVGNLFSDSVSLDFNATSFVINAGNTGTFPWLSTFASNFDKYKVHKLVVHLVSNQPTSIAGRIGVGIDYDSTDPLPADRGEFFNLTHHQETSPWDSLILNIPIKPEERFVNSHTATDSKLIDCGQIIVMADQIVATSSNLADIIVEYVIELIQPQQAIFMTQKVYSTAITSFANLNNAGPVIAKQVPTTSTTVLEFTVPTGYYLITFDAIDIEGGTPTLVPTVHAATGSKQTSGSSSSAMGFAQFKATGPDSSVKFTFGGTAISNLEHLQITFTRVSAVEYLAQSLYTPLGTY